MVTVTITARARIAALALTLALAGTACLLATPDHLPAIALLAGMPVLALWG